MSGMINAINGINGSGIGNSKPSERVESSDFFSILKSALDDVNKKQIKADNALKDIATGEVKDLHQAAIAINKAEISMKMMLEVRNKALNAYKEILKTPM
jgi:flagellar hook-basal body complex protein FliE